MSPQEGGFHGAPSGLDLHLVLDNRATRKRPKVRAWLARRPRFHIHCTPTSVWRLNEVKHWFAAVSQRAIRLGPFDRVPRLERTIGSSIADCDEPESPFAWVATTDSVLGKLERLFKRICGTEH